MASRPKSASGSSSRSFLDDLLGSNDNNDDLLPLSSRTTSPRQRKSVRFFDEGFDDDLSTTQTQESRSIRPHSTALDSLLNNTKQAQKQQSNVRSKSDWLGLGGGGGGVGGSSDDDNNTHKKSNEKSTTKTSSQDEPEWITSGLKARQSRQSNQDSISTSTTLTSKNRPSFLIDTDPLKTSTLTPSPSLSPSTTTTTAITIDTNEPVNKSTSVINRNWQPKLLSDVEKSSSSSSSSPLSGIKKFVQVGQSELQKQQQQQQQQQQNGQTFSNRKSDTEQQQKSNENQSDIIHNKLDIQHHHQQQNQLGFPRIDENLNAINFQQQQQQQQQNSMIIPNEEIMSSIIINQDGQQQQQQQQQQSSLIVLQTKLRILTLEKSFLEQSLDQMKRNHQDELQAMISLYEQQMHLTSEMYKRHENMIQEERDRRIIELKNQLKQSEKEMNMIRDKYNERLVKIEEEYRKDNEHIQEQYDTTTKRMIEEHEMELKRLEQRLSTETESSLQTSSDLVHNQTKSVTELMAKWEESAYKIEKLQRSVIAKQEEISRLQTMNNSDDVLANKVTEIDERWKTFLNDMQQQRNDLETMIRDEHEKYFNDEQSRMKVCEEKMNQEHKELESMKEKFAEEVMEWRQRESVDAQQLMDERKKLKEEITLFEERRLLLEQLYDERKKMLDNEQERISKQSEEILQKQTELDQKESLSLKSSLNLEQQQQQLQMKKRQFDHEKQQMTMLGKTLEQRAEELEKLSQMALKEKMDVVTAMDEIERLRSELKKETVDLEKSKNESQIYHERLAIDRNQLEQQYKLLRELRDSIVCNLCGQIMNLGGNAQSSWTTMMTTKSTGQQDIGSGFIYSLINGGYMMRQQYQPMNAENVDKNNNKIQRLNPPWNSFRASKTADNPSTNLDDDKTLLLWQLASQQDSAALAEETRFLKILMNSHQSKSKPL
ncbi:uncharacterized protein LOC124494078 [Dermatophagoides farinae]|uniref:uncharacterized protein LOC124494078 n=1 Tax=Dermatophagoides farinae TaxID=6954 RepID=UPI003F5FB339